MTKLTPISALAGQSAPSPLQAADDWQTALANHLVVSGTLEPQAMTRAINAQSETGARLDHILLKLGLVEERPLAQALAKTLGIHHVDADDFPNECVLSDTLSEKFLRYNMILPLKQRSSGGILLGMVDPLDDACAKAISLRLGAPVERAVVSPSHLENAFAKLYSDTDGLDDLGDGLDGSADESDIARLRDMANDAPVIRLVNLMIRKALEAGASDIHIEPSDTALSVRFRIDGALIIQDSPPKRLHAAIVSRIKIMSGLNIAERRLPQDGRVKTVVSGREIDLRVATAPALHGEGVVLRLHDKNAVQLDFPALGFGSAAIKTFTKLLSQSHGIVLVTGPTGSGKTTTLYTALGALNSEERKIITVEDPIEYHVPGVNQIQAKPDIGLTFAAALRSILRQDPDVIMIGEIRDVETARIAVQAALTGHLVLATLHTNTAASAVTRLIDMGVEDYLLASTLTGVLAQRLVRRLCPDCKREIPQPIQAAQAGVDAPSGPFFEANGCGACNGRGTKGRLVVQETLTMTDALRAGVLNANDASALEQIAIDGGMEPMLVDAMAKASSGLCSAHEALRVCAQI